MAEKQTKKKKNDPVRARRAWARFAAALAAALALLAASEFGIVKLARGAVPIAQLDRVAAGDYVQQDLSLILDNIAVGYRGETANEVYAVAPSERGLYVFCFPERWFVPELAVRAQTDAWLADRNAGQDRYLRVSGTARTMPEDLRMRTRSWFNQNADALAQIGLIPEGADMDSCVSECVICVDQVGGVAYGVVMLLSLAAFLLLGYALIVLLRILLHGYRAAQPKKPSGRKPKEEQHAKA